MDRKNGLPPVHPGEILREYILPEVGLSVTAAAKALGVSRQMVHDILAERKPLSAIMCLKVSRLPSIVAHYHDRASPLRSSSRWLRTRTAQPSVPSLRDGPRRKAGEKSAAAVLTPD